MKLHAILGITLTLALGAFAQILAPIMAGSPAAAGCTTPTGTNFTESFGDSATLCWTAGPSSCNHTWTIGAGSGESIVSSPASPPANTACANSLQIVDPNAGNAWIDSTFTGITAGTSFDVVFSFQMVSNSITNGNSMEVLCITTNGGTCDSGGTIAKMTLSNPSASITVTGQGATLSASAGTITNGTWHTITLHHDATLANCSIAVDAGGAQTFTCNIGTAGQINIGNSHGNTLALTYVVGNVAF